LHQGLIVLVRVDAYNRFPLLHEILGKERCGKRFADPAFGLQKEVHFVHDVPWLNELFT
jgi:hypothetical protein